MKSPSANPLWNRRVYSFNTPAFTLVEMMTTLAIFSLVVIAMVSLQIFGFKINSLTAGKLKSTAASLKALDQIRDQVREAYAVSVGNGNSSSFTTTESSGDALQIYPTTNNNYVRIYVDTNLDTLYEWNSTNGGPLALASEITNQTVFQKVDYDGDALANNQEHYAIRMTLQFSQLDYRVPTNTYDDYTLQTEMTPRTQ